MELNESFESQINRSDYKILIVDDVVSNVLLLKILLTNEKFQVCTANCGNACIEQAKAEKHQEQKKSIFLHYSSLRGIGLISCGIVVTTWPRT